jgi:hypothetical protein
VCRKLSEWGVEGAPWAKVERRFSGSTKPDAKDWYGTFFVAGECLAARRQKKVLPFLLDTMKSADEQASLGAARTLLKQGYPSGLERIAKHIGSMAENWCEGYEDLMALAGFLGHKRYTKQEWDAAMSIARVAYERREEIFQSYFSRMFEALGEMGALCRVEKTADGITLRKLVATSYNATHGRLQWMPMAELYYARIRSAQVSAEQEGITLPPQWLEEFVESERSIIERFAAAGWAAGANEKVNAQRALEELDRDARSKRWRRQALLRLIDP